MLKNIEKLLKRKDRLPENYLVEQMDLVVKGSEIDKMVLDSAEVIFKMSDLTDEQKKDFVQNLATNPVIIMDGAKIENGAKIKRFVGNEITFTFSTQTETVTRNFKIVNRESKLHGESRVEETNGDYLVTIYDDDKMTSQTKYEKGLTTYYKYDENENQTEIKFGQFDHLPKASNLSEQTKFMIFYQTLASKLRSAFCIRNKQICLHAIPNYKVFADWTKEFAKSNNYQVTLDGEHINWTKDIPFASTM